MARINLNVPPAVRDRLRTMASRTGRTEAEMARTLLVDALEAAWRDAFYQKVAAAHDADLKARDLAVLRAFEHLDG